MAFNGYKLSYPAPRVAQVNDTQETNSILSDDQSSWVVFNPDSDILSLTNTNTNSRQYSESENESLADLDQTLEQTQQSSQPKLEDDQEQDTDQESDHEDLIDNLPSKQFTPRSYDKINNWKLNNDLIDDNTASWDLDENLSNMSLDTSILRLQSFYGDELIRNLSNKDYKNFKRMNLSLSQYLNRKPNPIRDQMLIRLLPLSQQLQLKNMKPSHIPKHTLDHGLFNYHKRLIHEDDYSSTASSSLIICGGEAWNDL